LKELEGKVSLVFSNRVLHWVEDKETAAKNISRFLATNGQIYINITAILDVTPNLSTELRENFTKFPSIDEQFEIWVKLLTDEGIELSLAKLTYLEAFYDRNTFAGNLFLI
jgi:trans-aconitate methyltransferase